MGHDVHSSCCVAGATSIVDVTDDGSDWSGFNS